MVVRRFTSNGSVVRKENQVRVVLCYQRSSVGLVAICRVILSLLTEIRCDVILYCFTVSSIFCNIILAEYRHILIKLMKYVIY